MAADLAGAVAGQAPSEGSDPPTRFGPRSRGGIRARVNAAGGAQLRLDATDALETRHSPPGGRGVWRQPVELAVGATTSLLHRLGFTSWQRAQDTGTVTAPLPVDVPGWVVTAGADINGRPVSFVRAGDRASAGAEWSAGGSDGSETLTPATVAETLNSAQRADGLAYPTFHEERAADLRDSGDRGRLAAQAVPAPRGAPVAGRRLTDPGAVR